MVARTTKIPVAKAGGKLDDEVATAEHDALLGWVIEQLEGIATTLFSRDTAWREQQIGQAKATAMKRWADKAQTLRDYARGAATLYRVWTEVAITEAGRTTLAAAATVLKRWAAEVPVADPPARCALGWVEGYAVMKPVERINAGRPDAVKRTAAGFVDVVARIHRPEALALDGPAQDAEPADGFENTYPTEAEQVAFAEQVTPENVQWSTHSTVGEVWFNVRTGEFTLGEILQELKGLQALEKRTQVVMLCVERMDARMRAHIEHEGFGVLCRSTWVAAGAAAA